MTVMAVLLIAYVPFVSASSNFKDVNTYEEEIEFLVSMGIIKGFDNNTFKPNDSITRLQAIQMILREQGFTDYSNIQNPGFIDLKPGSYGYEEVAKAVELGVINGKINSQGQKYFDPFGPLTRGQMAKILTLAYDIPNNYPAGYTDVINHYDNEVYQYVSALTGYGITTGYCDGTFRPNLQLSRQHFALFMARYLDDTFTSESTSFSYEVFLKNDVDVFDKPNGKKIDRINVWAQEPVDGPDGIHNTVIVKQFTFDNWVYIIHKKSNGQIIKGYIPSQKISPNLFAVDYGMINNTSGTALLSEPSVNSTKITTIPHGALIRFISPDDTWAEVQYAGKIGYIMMRDTSL